MAKLRMLRLLWLATALPLVACGSSRTDSGAGDDERTRYLNETSTNWAMTRGYPRGTAYNPFEQELNPSTVHGLQVLWQADSSAEFVIQHSGRAFSSSGDAYDLATGELLWSTEQTLPNAVVCKGALFAVGASIEKRSPSSGELTGSADLGMPDALFSLPTAKDSSVVFATANAAATDATEPGGAYLAYDVVAQTTRTVDTPGSDYRTLAPAALTSGMLYAPALEPAAGGFRYLAFGAVFDANAAQQRNPWATVIDEGIPSPAELPRLGAMVIGARVLLPSADRHALVSLDQRTGALAWRSTAASSIDSLAVDFDYAYVAGSDEQGQLVVQGFDVSSGAAHFTQTLGAGTVTGQIAVGGEVLYLGSSAGELIALDASTGAVLTRVALGGSVGNPIVSSGKVFTSNGEQVVALGLPPIAP